MGIKIKTLCLKNQIFHYQIRIKKHQNIIKINQITRRYKLQNYLNHLDYNLKVVNNMMNNQSRINKRNKRIYIIKSR